MSAQKQRKTLNFSGNLTLARWSHCPVGEIGAEYRATRRADSLRNPWSKSTERRTQQMLAAGVKPDWGARSPFVRGFVKEGGNDVAKKNCRDLRRDLRHRRCTWLGSRIQSRRKASRTVRRQPSAQPAASRDRHRRHHRRFVERQGVEDVLPGVRRDLRRGGGDGFLRGQRTVAGYRFQQFRRRGASRRNRRGRALPRLRDECSYRAARSLTQSRLRPVPRAQARGATGEAKRGSASVSEWRRPEPGARDDSAS